MKPQSRHPWRAALASILSAKPQSRRPWRHGIAAVLFPPVPRDFPFRRGLRTVLRAVHILAGGTLLGGHIFDQPPAVLEPWLWGTLASGLLLLATDLYASCAVLLEVRGAVVVLKLALTALVPLLWDLRLELLGAALLAGAVSSHMPGRYRHHVLALRRRVVPDQRRG